MGGDVYCKKDSKIEDWPWFCQKCLKENGNGSIVCPPIDCPDYARLDPDFENVDYLGFTEVGQNQIHKGTKMEEPELMLVEK